MTINLAILIGYCGADAELRYTANGEAVCKVRIGTTGTWKDKVSGEKMEATEWHRIVFYRRQAQIAGEWLKKGTQVYIEGKIKTRKWRNKEGLDRFTTEIEASEMRILDQRQERLPPEAIEQPPFESNSDLGNPIVDWAGDDLPF